MILNEFGFAEIVKHGFLLRYGFQNSYPSVEILVKVVCNRIISIKIKLSDTVENLKARVEQIDGYPSRNLRYIFDDGQTLEDGRTLQSYNRFKDKTVVHALPR